MAPRASSAAGSSSVTSSTPSPASREHMADLDGAAVVAQPQHDDRARVADRLACPVRRRGHPRFDDTIGRGGHGVRAVIDHDLAPLLIGRDASGVPALWDEMAKALLYVGRGGLAAFAIAGVDVALWDLRGVVEERPLYQLIGAQSRAPGLRLGRRPAQAARRAARPDPGVPRPRLSGRQGQARAPDPGRRTRSGWPPCAS